MPNNGQDHNPDGWTLNTLYIHVMEISKSAKEGVSAAMASAEKAILKAETATEKRFDSVNEFRQAMKDQQSNFAGKDETDRRLKNLEIVMAQKAGERQGVGITAGVIVQVISSTAAAAAVIGVILATRH